MHGLIFFSKISFLQRAMSMNNLYLLPASFSSDDISHSRNDESYLTGSDAASYSSSDDEESDVEEEAPSNVHPTQASSRQPIIYREVSISLTDADVLLFGLRFAGFTHARQQRVNLDRNIDRFKSFYGVPPTTITPFFIDLRNEHPSILYKDCLMTANWLYSYDSYPVLAGRWGYCKEYIGSTVICYASKMAALRRKKILFQFKHNRQYKGSVDCYRFTVQEMRLDPGTEWFDYKSHSCGLKYEFGLSIYEPKVIWINGPFPPSVSDITVFRGGDATQNVSERDRSALYFQLEEGSKMVADSGYAGGPKKIVMTKEEHSKKFKVFLARAKNLQETFHWRLKAFNILGHRFRHGNNTANRTSLHKMAVEAVAVIVQYDYENGHPPFEVL